MKIVSCFSHIDEIAPLAAAGADELYCAVRGLPAFGEPAFLAGGSLAAAVRRCRRAGVKVSLAVNSLAEAGFTRGGEKKLLAKLAAADEAGVDAFIVASPAWLELLNLLPRRRAQVHLSSVQPCFNSLTAGLFLDLGVTRLILPNQLTPHEARGIMALCRARGAETEIFDYRFFGCAYVNGRCFLHRPDFYTRRRGPARFGSMCRLNLSAGELGAPALLDADPAWRPRLGPVARRLSARLACGGAPRMANMASFFDYFSAGADYLKYGTRQDPPAVKLGKVRLVRSMLDLAGRLSAAHPRAEARRRFLGELRHWDGRDF